MTKAAAATIEELTQLRDARDAAQAEIAELREEIAQLRHNVEAYRRMAFGPSSEKRRATDDEPTDSRQGHLFEQQLLAEAIETTERKDLHASTHVEPAKPRKPGKRRKKFPDHVPEYVTKYSLPEDQRTCACGDELHEMGVETCRELERIEMTLVHRIERTKYACRNCEEGVRTTPGPDRPFEKGLLGRGFLAHLILERFGNHMPYHRLEKKFEREGVDVLRSTQERSMARCAERLEPLYDLLCEQVRGAPVIFTDDTPVTIARPRGQSGSKQGRVWIYLDREGRHAYDFTDSRKQEGPLGWLDGYTGFIHADAYPGYDAAFAPNGATEVACWAHTRRKFIEAERSEPELSAEILARIRELYAIEKLAKDATDDERREARQEKALPILEELRARLVVLETQALPKSPLGKAIGYAQRQWDALCTYTTDGRLSIDNNAAERALRGIAVGRKNWLFFQREGGGKTATILLSLLKTAEAAGVNPMEWFRDVLVRIDRVRVPDWSKLLPHAWKEHFQGEVESWQQKAASLLGGL